MFKTARGEEIEKAQIVARIADFILQDPKAKYEITVGTDSQSHKDTKMVEVIAVHRKGQGGMFFYSTEYIRKITNLKQKINEETSRSLMLADGIVDRLEEILFDHNIFIDELDISFQIHCDIGTCGKTNMLIKEITSWVQSYGYLCCIKPYSYAASDIADRISK